MGKPSILLIGDPNETDKQTRLRFVQSEMQDIVNALPSAEKVVYRGALARPNEYFSSHPARFSLIHFAAHAVANEASPLDSAVLLSGSDEKRKLFARDVMGVPLKADVVTISACRGAGKSMAVKDRSDSPGRFFMPEPGELSPACGMWMIARLRH